LKIAISFTLLGGEDMLSKEDFGLYSPAMRAFKLMDCKIAAGRMLCDSCGL